MTETEAQVMARDLVTAADVYWGDDGLGGTAGQVWDERHRQIAKWGLQTRPSGTDAKRWKPEEDRAKAIYEIHLKNGELTWLDILKEEVYEAFAEEDPAKLAVELVQVMAVTASWLQDMQLKGEI